LTLQNTPRQQLQLPDLDIGFVSLADTPPKLDMTLLLSETDSGLVGSNHYNSELYSAMTIRGLMQFYRGLLTVVPGEPGIVDAPRSELIAAAEIKAREILQPSMLPLQLSGMRHRRGQQVIDV
jgi:hypothetical protein